MNTPIIKQIEIEVNTHCNYRCNYCPEKKWPKKISYMKLDLYEEIIEKAANYEQIKYVCFNAYNEPTLDRYFEERIQRLAKTDMKLILFTNASMLEDDKVNLLYESGVVESIRVNLPSIDEDEYMRVTGSKLLSQTLKHMDYIIQKGLPLELLVNGTPLAVKHNYNRIQSRYSQYANVKVFRYETSDRAGLLENEYALNYHHRGKLRDCMQVNNKLCINVTGDFYLCCMDYFQKYQLGNIKDKSINDILKGMPAQKLFRQISGEEEVPSDFICLKCFAASFSKLSGRRKCESMIPED